MLTHLPLPQAFLASLEMLAPSRKGRGKTTRLISPLPLREGAFGQGPNGGGVDV
jgi:hypothetical protein